MKPKCDECSKGVLESKKEAIEIKVGDRIIKSDPVVFLECDYCQQRLFVAKESIKHELTAALRLLESAVRGEDLLKGRDLSFLLGVCEISARRLSLDLGLSESSVTQWVTRNKKFEYHESIGLAIILLGLLLQTDPAKELGVKSLIIPPIKLAAHG